MKNQKKQGVLILNQIEFDECIKRAVHKSNNTSGKVTLPKGWIGKEVYIIMVKK